MGKLSLLVLVSGSCLLHLGGCTVQVEGRPRPVVSMGRIGGELELSMEEYTDESTSSGTTQKDTSTIFEEELSLDTQGDVYHPNLMTYIAMIGLGLKQQSFDSNGDTDSSSGSLTRYQVNMNVLPMKPYPINISFSKNDTVAPRRFRSPLRIETSSVSGRMRLRVPDWPMIISWISTETEQTSDMSNETNLYGRSSETLSYELLHDFNERSHLSFRSNWDKNSQKQGGSSTDTNTSRYRLDHDLEFGNNRQYSLDSSLGYLDKSGKIDSETFDWSERLFLNHSDSFSTFYNSLFTTSTFGLATSETISGTAGLNHRLYENLVTRFDVFGSKTEFSSGSETTWMGGNLQFDYTRSNPWGELSSKYSIGLTNTEQSGGSGTAFVIDESHTADTLTEFTLDERNIDVSSIVVTDSTGTDIYTLGDDYTITVVGDQVEILADDAGVTFPNLNDGDELLVDYFFETDDSVEETSVDQLFRIEQEFDNGLSVFYYHDRRDEQIDSSSSPDIVPDDFQENTVGLLYARRRASFRAEHSSLKSLQDSVDSTRLSATYVWPVSTRTSLSGRLSQSWSESTDSGGTTDTSQFKAKGRISTRLSKRIKLSGIAEWRNKNSSDDGRDEGLVMGAALEYKYRALSFKAGWDSYSLDRPDTKTNNSTFYLRLTRRF